MRTKTFLIAGILYLAIMLVPAFHLALGDFSLRHFFTGDRERQLQIIHAPGTRAGFPLNAYKDSNCPPEIVICEPNQMLNMPIFFLDWVVSLAVLFIPFGLVWIGSRKKHHQQ